MNAKTERNKLRAETEYVYLFMHPKYGHVYIGIARNLGTRIRQHLYSDGDNIPREYADVLKGCKTYYFECKNKAQAKAYESILIDRHKPVLNSSEKYDSCGYVKAEIPEWKEYVLQAPTFNGRAIETVKPCGKRRIKLMSRKNAGELVNLWLSNVETTRFSSVAFKAGAVFKTDEEFDEVLKKIDKGITKFKCDEVLSFFKAYPKSDAVFSLSIGTELGVITFRVSKKGVTKSVGNDETDFWVHEDWTGQIFTPVMLQSVGTVTNTDWSNDSPIVTGLVIQAYADNLIFNGDKPVSQSVKKDRTQYLAERYETTVNGIAAYQSRKDITSP